MIWVLEREVFSDGDKRLTEAALAQGHQVKYWDDEWWETGRFPKFRDDLVLFHGSLGNAAKIRRELPWNPGSFCDVERFTCASWYEGAAKWLLHCTWQVSTVSDFVADPDAAFATIGATDAVFVRPDSPLKPFSGRVLKRGEVSYKALDHGYYYDDEALPIVIAPVVDVQQEWRFVVCEGEVVAGSGYEALCKSRKEVAALPTDAAWCFAQEVAHDIEAPEPAYVLDICASAGALRLLELNPLSGADWYACARAPIVAALEVLVERLYR